MTGTDCTASVTLAAEVDCGDDDDDDDGAATASTVWPSRPPCCAQSYHTSTTTVQHFQLRNINPFCPEFQNGDSD